MSVTRFWGRLTRGRLRGTALRGIPSGLPPNSNLLKLSRRALKNPNQSPENPNQSPENPNQSAENPNQSPADTSFYTAATPRPRAAVATRFAAIKAMAMVHDVLERAMASPSPSPSEDSHAQGKH